MRKYKTVSEAKRLNVEKGQHFFDRATMRFFRSRIASGMLKGCYFVTSEQFDDNSPRLFTLRYATDNGSIETVGEFQQFKSVAEAKEFLAGLPVYFVDAVELARAEFNGKGEAGAFVRHASIEKARPSFDSFCGACAWVCENYKLLDMGWLKFFADDYNKVN